jgi:hypothetical protein
VSTIVDEVREIDEGLAHATRALHSFRSQGQLRMAEVAQRKIDTLLELRLMVTQGET